MNSGRNSIPFVSDPLRIRSPSYPIPFVSDPLRIRSPSYPPHPLCFRRSPLFRRPKGICAERLEPSREPSPRILLSTKFELARSGERRRVPRTRTRHRLPPARARRQPLPNSTGLAVSNRM
jgi:hypothetical protein